MDIWTPRPVISENRTKGGLAARRSRSGIQVRPSRVGQKQPRLPTKHGHDPGVHRLTIGRGGRVRNPRPVRRELGAHLAQVVVRELHRLAVGQKLDVNLPRTDERALRPG